MRILLSNDDGIHAPGIQTLAKALREFAEVQVVAPDRNRSGASNSLTLESSLRTFTFENGDIAVQMGNASHPEVQRAIQHIFASAKKHGKPSGILAPVEADARRYLEWGATFVAVGSDLGVFRSATQKLADAFKK